MTIKDVAGLIERLRKQAHGESEVHKLLADAKTARNRAAEGEPNDGPGYSWLKPEQTDSWKAADALSALTSPGEGMETTAEERAEIKLFSGPGYGRNGEQVASLLRDFDRLLADNAALRARVGEAESGWEDIAAKMEEAERLVGLVVARATSAEAERDRLAAQVKEAQVVSPELRRLVIAARVVAFEDSRSPVALRELDEASEAFAEAVPWNNEPGEG